MLYHIMFLKIYATTLLKTNLSNATYIFVNFGEKATLAGKCKNASSFRDKLLFRYSQNFYYDFQNVRYSICKSKLQIEQNKSYGMSKTDIFENFNFYYE
jgi:hypothetical protein